MFSDLKSGFRHLVLDLSLDRAPADRAAHQIESGSKKNTGVVDSGTFGWFLPSENLLMLVVLVLTVAILALTIMVASVTMAIPMQLAFTVMSFIGYRLNKRGHWLRLC